MASVFKLGRDKGKRNAHWYFEYQDQHGNRRMKKGFTDKWLTRQLAAKMEMESRQRRLGLIDVEQEVLAERKSSAVAKHLQDYDHSLRAKENTDKHVNLTLSRVRRIVNDCEFLILGDINADDVETCLEELREEDGIGYRTYNHYLQAIDAWCNWMVGRRRLDRNPIAGIPRLNPDLDIRHPRRALSTNEVARLLKSARESGVSIQCYTGEERARIYTVSYMTGLRKSELASLTPSSFELDDDPPTLTVEAKSSKHRKKDILPLHPDLIPMLHEWNKNVAQNEPLFPKLGKRKTWLMVKKDLERAGIPYETEEGIADFHAAGRHTHITELLRHGATLTQTKELARHGDVRMTMRYTHIGIKDQAKALKSLPTPGSCQDIVRKSTGSSSPELSPDDQECPAEERETENENPCNSRGSVTKCPPESSSGKESKNWRERRPTAIQSQSPRSS